MPAFMRDFNSMTGRAVGRLLKKREGIWRKKTYDRVDLKDAGAIADAIVYTLANAVAAGLVAKHSQWPGLHSTPQDLRGGGREFTARATGPFFAKRIKSGVDDVRQFRIEAPSAEKVDMNPDDYSQHIAQRLRAVEKDVAANMAELGRKVLGAKNAGLVKTRLAAKHSRRPHRQAQPPTRHQEPGSTHRGHQGASGVPLTVQGSLARLLRGRSRRCVSSGNLPHAHLLRRQLRAVPRHDLVVVEVELSFSLSTRSPARDWGTVCLDGGDGRC